MTATVLAFRTEMQLPSNSVPGNPDMVTVLPDFPGEHQAAEWTDMVAGALLAEQGSFSADAARRLAAQPANQVSVNEDDVANMLVRTVAVVQRPSGRLAGAAFVHLSVHAERVVTPEGAYASLRIGTPVVQTAGLATQTEVLEAALLNLLDQAEEAAQAVVNALHLTGTECVVWSLPIRLGGAQLLKELNLRLVQRFYGTLPSEPLQLAA